MRGTLLVSSASEKWTRSVGVMAVVLTGPFFLFFDTAPFTAEGGNNYVSGLFI